MSVLHLVLKSRRWLYYNRSGPQVINLRSSAPYNGFFVLSGAFTAPERTLLSTLAYTLTTTLNNTLLLPPKPIAASHGMICVVSGGCFSNPSARIVNQRLVGYCNPTVTRPSLHAPLSALLLIISARILLSYRRCDSVIGMFALMTS